MKTVISILLSGVVLVGGFCYPSSIASNEKATIQIRHHEVVIFPGIKTSLRTFNLQVIESYCRQRGIDQLGKERVRLFVQPMGVVDRAVEIDIMNRQLTMYPGTHDREEVIKTQLSEEQVTQI